MKRGFSGFFIFEGEREKIDLSQGDTASLNFISDFREDAEYFPYGEMWVEERSNSALDIRYAFTGKEYDSETGWYYYGARYLDPRLGMWTTIDPPMMKGDYFSKPGDFETDHNYFYELAHDTTAKLKGHGGVFNPVNLNLYHYAGQNPVKFVDPDGNATVGMAFNFDYGADYANEAAQNFKNGEYGQGALNLVAGTCEATYNTLGALFVAGNIGKISAIGGTALANPSIQNRLLPNGINFADRMGKLNQHAKEWGVSLKGGPAAVADRMQKVVNSVFQNAKSVKQGGWHDVKNALFFSDGKNVVVTKGDGAFVTILKDAQNNTWFKKASEIKK